MTAAPLYAAITADQFHSDSHPRVFATRDVRDALWNKIEETSWAGDFYRKMKAQVDPLVDRHVSDPQFIVSRLQMHWEEGKRHTHFYTQGNFIPRREGNAPYPTVRLLYGRAAPGTPPFPSDVSKLQPYGNGDLPILRDGKWETVPFEKTQLGTEDINKALINRAYYASIVFYFTGDKRYAKFAADILWTFVRGASYHEQVNPDQEGGPFGYLSWETLGDTRRFEKLPLAYDFIHDYLVNEYFDSDEFRNGRPGELWAPGHPQGKAWALGRIEIVFKKFIENKLTRGGGLEGNWNTNEHQSAMLYALAMENDDRYSDKKGREYYVDKLIYGPTTSGHGAYVDVARANLNPDTGLWPEPPGGYGQGSIQQLVQFGFIYAVNGIDLIGDEPLLRKAAVSFPQVAFPNGYSTGWGDSNYNPIFTDQAEYMIAYARRTGDSRLEDTFTSLLQFAGGRKLDSDQALFFFVPRLKEVKEPMKSPRTSYSPDHSIVFGRNPGDSPVNSLAYTVSGYGKKSAHRQPNGMTMELFGRGHVLGVDPGIGPDYWHDQHHRYNAAVAAHNCVIPNGAAASKEFPQDLRIMHAEPAIRAGLAPESELSQMFQFTDTFNDYKTEGMAADQRRTIGIIRTSPQSGYYVDIFRSKVREGENGHHDYLYHNQARSLALFAGDGSPLPLSDEPLDEKSGFGYDYFQDDKSLATAADFYGVFDYGVDDVRMKVWMPGQKDRTIYSVTGPPNGRHYQPQLKQFRVPTLLVRQKGEAWDRPFVAVYEPFGAGLESSLRRVRRMDGAAGSGEVVALAVERTDGLDYILNCVSSEKSLDDEGVSFQGIYGVVSGDLKGAQRIYLGTGKKLIKDGLGIDAGSAETKACLQRQGDGFEYSSEAEVALHLPYAGAGKPVVAVNGQSVEAKIVPGGIVVRAPAAQKAMITIGEVK